MSMPIGRGSDSMCAYVRACALSAGLEHPGLLPHGDHRAHSAEHGSMDTRSTDPLDISSLIWQFTTRDHFDFRINPITLYTESPRLCVDANSGVRPGTGEHAHPVGNHRQPLLSRRTAISGRRAASCVLFGFSRYVAWGLQELRDKQSALQARCRSQILEPFAKNTKQRLRSILHPRA